MKKWTLQIRLTVIVGVILLAVCLLLTTNSLFFARSYYGDYAMLLESGLADPDPAVERMTEYNPALAAPGELYQEASEKFSAQALIAMTLMIFLAFGCTYFATGHVLRPLKNLTASAQRVDDQHLDRRVPETGARGEVLALTESFNRMLDRLEESFLVQKNFAVNAAHALKTPLAVIKSSLQVLEMTPCPKEVDYQEFMVDTGESLDRIIKTVEGLLALANLEAAPVKETVELRPLLDQAVRELSDRAKKSQVRLSVSGEAEEVQGNPSLLYRAFYNLIENAVKYNLPGRTVRVELKQDQALISIRVMDTGKGIPEDALQHVFEPFYRADPSRSQDIPGYGLGLAVVRLIAERHGGSVRVTSKIGEGRIFTVELNQM